VIISLITYTTDATVRLFSFIAGCVRRCVNIEVQGDLTGNYRDDPRWFPLCNGCMWNKIIYFSLCRCPDWNNFG